MATLFDPKERRVLPNLRSFTLTANLGELNDWQESRDHHSRTLSIEDYLLTWEQNKTIAIAGDLLSAAFVNRFTDNQKIKEAALFVLSNKGESTNTLLNFAENIINPPTETSEEKGTLKSLEKSIETNNIGNSIREVKNRLSQYPYNPILYVELSRLYSILAHKEKSLHNMSIALHLAPNNRYVLRAASRLYTHFGLVDYIHHIIKNSDIVQQDPWITSTEIALATIMNKSSRLIKKGLQMIKSGKYSPFSLTELSASIGTLEFFHGNNRKTKSFLKIALRSPNDNSLAQVEWIANKINLFDFNPSNFDIENKYEALTIDDYHNSEWKSALKNSVAWFCDLPFSKQPVIFGSHIAGDILNKPKIARKLLLAGLVSHPNDAQIINNLMYSFALENKLDEAESHMKRLRYCSDIPASSKICLTGTFGLISFRKGDQDEGRRLYLEAIEASNSQRNNHLKRLAELNYAREELLSKSEYVEFAMKAVNKIPDNTGYYNVDKLKTDVIRMYDKMKK